MPGCPPSAAGSGTPTAYCRTGVWSLNARAAAWTIGSVSRWRTHPGLRPQPTEYCRTPRTLTYARARFPRNRVPGHGNHRFNLGAGKLRCRALKSTTGAVDPLCGLRAGTVFMRRPRGGFFSSPRSCVLCGLAAGAHIRGNDRADPNFPFLGVDYRGALHGRPMWVLRVPAPRGHRWSARDSARLPELVCGRRRRRSRDPSAQSFIAACPASTSQLKLWVPNWGWCTGSSLATMLDTYSRC